MHYLHLPDDFMDAPDESRFELPRTPAGVKRWLTGTFPVSRRDPPPVKKQLILNVPFAEHPLYLMWPGESRNNGLVLRGYFYEAYRSRHPLEGLDVPDVLNHCRGEEAPIGRRRHGSIEEGESGCITITPGIRRFTRLSEEETGLALFRYALDSREWYASAPLEKFYGQCVAPYFRDRPAGDPVEWAASRIAFAVPCAMLATGKDYNIKAALHPYQKTAALVCNPAPEKLLRKREYTLNADDRELIIEIRRNFEKSFCPELVLFALENRGRLSRSDYCDPALLRFAKSLPALLENGLNIDRVLQLTKAGENAGLPSRAAVLHAVSLTHGIYSGDKKPWWFKEDFDLRPAKSAKFRWDEASLRERECLAREAGYSFRHAESVYRRSGRPLAEIPGVDREQIMAFCCEVVRDYGIGNSKRALNVLRFAKELLLEVGETQRASALSSLGTTLKRSRPSSEIEGRLEGSECNFAKPGLLGLLLALDENLCKERKFDALTIEPRDMEHGLKLLQAPLLTRARLKPAIKEGLSGVPLLTSYFDESLLALPVVRAEKNALAANKPLSSWLDWEQSLNEECGSGSEEVSQLYFTFFAAKMPDPFHPPKGFLRALNEIRSIPNPHWRFPGLEEPGQAREETSKNNARSFVRRYETLAALLDVWLMGAIPWEGVERTFAWLTEDLSEAKHAAAECDAVWDMHGENGPHYYSSYEYLAEEDIRLRRELSALEREAWLGQGDAVDNRRLSLLTWRTSKELEKLNRSFGDSWESELEEDRLSPEEQDQRSIARLRENAQRSVSDTLSRVRIARLNRLEEVYDGILWVRELAQERLVEPRILATFMAGLLESCKAGVNEDEDYTSCQKPMDSDRRFTLVRACKSGVLNTAPLKEVLNGQSEWPQTAGLLRELAEAAGLLWRAERMMAELSRIPRKEGTSEFKYKESSQQFRQFESELEPLFENNTFLRGGSFLRLKEECAWVVRYPAIKEVMETFAQQAFPLQYGSATRTAIGEANRTMASCWSMARCLSAAREAQLTLPPGTAVSEKGILQEADTPSPADWRSGIEALLMSDIPALKGRIVEMRRSSFGLLPVGGKIHLLHPVDEGRFELFRSCFGLESKSFKLLHASHSLNLPAFPGSAELKMFIRLLDLEHIIDWEHPELQICLEGAVPPADCAILGAAILLSTNAGVKYDKESFATASHNSDTGYRIIAYDDHGPRTRFPLSTSVQGRTDILGRSDLGDIDRAWLLGSVLVQSMDRGPLGGLARPFRENLLEILAGYGLQGVLKESWVCTSSFSSRWKGQNSDNSQDAGLRHFERAVKPCTDAWFSCYEEAQQSGETGGVVAEVRNLFAWLEERVKMLQPELAADFGYGQKLEELLHGLSDRE